jgi:hypothetical protein
MAIVIAVLAHSLEFMVVAETERICANCSASRTSDNRFCYCRRYSIVVERDGSCETFDVI